MPCSPSSLGSRIGLWIRNYDRIQALAVVLIYIQIACALIGSLSPLFNGVLLINLVVALFALVAIESSSQSLCRTYAVLLSCEILLDVAWFIFFSRAIWNFTSENYGPSFVFSLRLALLMQIIGFAVRFLSSFLWIQMYRLGVSSVNSSAYQEADFDVRSSFLNPSAREIPTQNSNANEFLGGSIYDPIYYSSLFEDGQDRRFTNQAEKQAIGYDRGAMSANGSPQRSPQLKPIISRSFQVGKKKKTAIEATKGHKVRGTHKWREMVDAAILWRWSEDGRCCNFMEVVGRWNCVEGRPLWW